MSKKILILEDDIDVAKICSKVLEKESYQVHVTYDPVSAAQMIQAERPDLVITDLLMPLGGGTSLLKVMKILGELNNVPVLVITGAADHEIKQMLQGHTVRCVLKKPFLPEQLTGEVKKIIGGSR